MSQHLQGTRFNIRLYYVAEFCVFAGIQRYANLELFIQRRDEFFWLWDVNAAASFVTDAVVRLRDKRKSICDQPPGGLAVLIPHLGSAGRIQKRIRLHESFWQKQ